jgi:hypothetical protein
MTPVAGISGRGVVTDVADVDRRAPITGGPLHPGSPRRRTGESLTQALRQIGRLDRGESGGEALAGSWQLPGNQAKALLLALAAAAEAAGAVVTACATAALLL